MSGDVAKLEHSAATPTTHHGDGAVILRMLDALLNRPDVDPAKLEQMHALYERSRAEVARRAYLEALAVMQAALPAAVRRGTGHNDKRYARFEDVIEAAREPMASHGFSLTFRTRLEANVIRVVGVLGHRDGHQEETELPLPADTTGNKNNVQSWGSSISYGKRYVAMTLLGIATDDDDDGKDAGAKPSSATLDQIKSLIADTGSDVTWFLEHYSVETLDDLTGKQRDEIKSKLSAKLAHMRRTNAGR